MKSKQVLNRVQLSEREIPKKWYNIAADLNEKPLPPLDPQTRQPITPDKLSLLFPQRLIEQEVSEEQFIKIPNEILKILLKWRPTPLVRARGLEELLETPAHIYFKNESVSPTGSHKSNTAVAQAYYNKLEHVKRLATETGAGQWGSALAMACNYFDLGCKVFMVKSSFDQKPYRRAMMQLWGAEVTASPSEETNAGKEMLERAPDSPGSLGMAISEAVEVAASDPETKYSLGSVLNHVILHQTIIGEETLKQLEKVDEYPDTIIGCVGGGSNFGGFAFPFVREILEEKPRAKKMRVIAVEPTACPTLTRGMFTYDYGDTAGLTPLLSMYTLGHDFVPAAIHAGGLRYHGVSPLVSALVHQGIVQAVAYSQNEVFDAALKFAKSEGIVPAPESAHAIRAAIDEALRAKSEGKKEVIVFNLSGHGYFDMSAYDAYLQGHLEDSTIDEEELQKHLKQLRRLSVSE
ncbi:MAG: TrpB-like pyridoxal phosphate-dependent enzyme [Bacteroidetes bacterium]|nr:TrpB-like pyridoxal phosphate-dependent enzyme [Bacteroidota bacterium]MCL5738762.1 TrpB-like pyridoxal phosphate-dependent enzyme [Bacteroidota bacterium]